ncbi:VPLPA-CTERM sorting domain-containing protein [Falsirhodobacter xinxiangensis]|uniref:VPLPA-CTERM sorting domain-containing protein n=1 Tax=Falsirhodobacter xinxiangensis TaxID=2530049 RepID=UPI0010AA1EA1|nr:VPLPA-CTERM sorting domain-containing protein [Rhodobacter xinxiangensis]
MFKFASAALSAAFLLAVPAAAAVIDVPVATGFYLETEGTGDFLIDSADAVADGYGESLLADLSVVFDTASPLTTATGSFTLRGDEGELLYGDLSGVSFGDDLVTLSFGNLTGAAAAAFGPLLSVEMFFFGGFELPIDGASYEVSLFAQGGEAPAPVPLPAGIVLLGSGLAALALRRRR